MHALHISTTVRFRSASDSMATAAGVLTAPAAPAATLGVQFYPCDAAAGERHRRLVCGTSSARPAARPAAPLSRSPPASPAPRAAHTSARKPPRAAAFNPVPSPPLSASGGTPHQSLSPPRVTLHSQTPLRLDLSLPSRTPNACCRTSAAPAAATGTDRYGATAPLPCHAYSRTL
jgi:hypothetical protein